MEAYNHLQSMFGVCWVSQEILIWSKGLAIIFSYFQQDRYKFQLLAGDWLLGCSLGFSFLSNRIP